LRIYKKLKIASIDELREKLESGEIESALGQRLAQHVRQGLSEAHAILLYHADDLRDAIEAFLLDKCGVSAVQVAGACRRRVEVVEEIDFVIQTDDFPTVVKKMERYGGRTPLLKSTKDLAQFALSTGIELRLHRAEPVDWGLCLIAKTGSQVHLEKLEAFTGKLTAARGKGPFQRKRLSMGRFRWPTSSRSCAKGTMRSHVHGKGCFRGLSA
jgi:DNA polymerase (family X)